MTSPNPYDARYSRPGYYWDLEPSSMCDRLLRHIDPVAKLGLTLIDLGCGEGRNSVYLASKGFVVTGLDISPAGLAKAERLASERGVTVNTVCGDIVDYCFCRRYDVVFSTGTVHYIPPAVRPERIQYFKGMTAPDGLHAISVLVTKPFIAPAPDADPDVTLFKSGELLSYYWDWEVLFCEESIFDCNSGGIPHRHCANRIIARKV